MLILAIKNVFPPSKKKVSWQYSYFSCILQRNFKPWPSITWVVSDFIKIKTTIHAHKISENPKIQANHFYIEGNLPIESKTKGKAYIQFVYCVASQKCLTKHCCSNPRTQHIIWLGKMDHSSYSPDLTQHRVTFFLHLKPILFSKFCNTGCLHRWY